MLGEDFAASLIWEEEFVVALPVDHPLARFEQVTLEQLAGEELVTYRENSALRLRLEKAMAKVGLEPRNAFICTEMGAVRALVAKGLGVAVLPRSIADEPGPAITVRPVGPEVLTWPVALVWRAGRRQPPGRQGLPAARARPGRGGRGRVGARRAGRPSRGQAGGVAGVRRPASGGCAGGLPRARVDVGLSCPEACQCDSDLAGRPSI